MNACWILAVAMPSVASGRDGTTEWVAVNLRQCYWLPWSLSFVQGSRRSSRSQWRNGKMPGTGLWLTWGASGWLSRLETKGCSCDMQQRHSFEKPRAVGRVVTSSGSRRGQLCQCRDQRGTRRWVLHLSPWVLRSHICPLFSQTPWEREGWEMRRGSRWWPNLKVWGSKAIS